MLRRFPIFLSCRRYFATRPARPSRTRIHGSQPIDGSVVSKVTADKRFDQLRWEDIIGTLPDLEANNEDDMPPRRKLEGADADKYSKRRIKKLRQSMPESSSSEDVMWLDVQELLGKETVDKAVAEGAEFDQPFELFQEVELDIVKLCGNGNGLALAPESFGRPWVIAVPFCFPGERVRAKIYSSLRMHSRADFLELITPNPEYRDESLVKCRYFRACGGCQYQMVPYDKQLELKRDVVINAYENYSLLDPSSLPEILSTLPSPMQYGYRTKLTPHFPVWKNKGPEERPPIGFNQVGRPGTIDIEECPIATKAINEEIPRARQKVFDNIKTFKQGVTLLLRESLELEQDLPLSTSLSLEQVETARTKKIVITNGNASVRERVDDVFFEYAGSSFFQNNNSVLSSLVDNTRKAIFPEGLTEKPTHLIDTFCGAGLFGICLAEHFEQIAGVESSVDSIMYAKRNARLNKIPSSKISFKRGDATDIFKSVKDFPAARTAMVIDPPRKGCSDEFVKQVIDFAPQTVVYVSCNVHSQARDVGMLLRSMEQKGTGKKYIVESLRGFDLFPQTYHVEGVAVLRLVDA